MDPFFSIIIPIYNASKTLEKCLGSVLSQSFQSFEIICIDDGSTDSSWEILCDFSFQDTRIKCHRQPNSGPSAARNKGLKEANGNYILFVDSDDYLYNDSAFHILYNTVTRNHGCDIVYFAGAFEESSGIYPDYSRSPKVYNYGYQLMEDHCLSSSGLVFGSIYQQCIKRELLNDNDICFNENIVYGEDRLFICTTFYIAKKSIVIPDILYCYVINNSSSLTHDEHRLPRSSIDNRAVATLLDGILKKSRYKYKHPHFRKYIHGLYLMGARGLNRKEINWSLIFRNSSSLRLFIKDILYYMKLFHY